MPAITTERTLTELDHVRITSLLRSTGGAPRRAKSGSPIGELLDSSAIVPSRQVPTDVVTMRSQVMIDDPQTGMERKITLCYPADSVPGTGMVSVLSPVGASLLGLRVGDVARWQTPDGLEKSATLQAIVFQPEASGNYTL
ncbi:MAG: transcription elongation factor GreAB [Rubrivivax sp. SCN 71-131]|jgi:regulator of nucleoside diphosphate kinase|nr:MAG: transcription elongation factor GreAB [Rubrivivax sp. SCN 71-131]